MLPSYFSIDVSKFLCQHAADVALFVDVKFCHTLFTSTNRKGEPHLKKMWHISHKRAMSTEHNAIMEGLIESI